MPTDDPFAEALGSPAQRVSAKASDDPFAAALSGASYSDVGDALSAREAAFDSRVGVSGVMTRDELAALPGPSQPSAYERASDWLGSAAGVGENILNSLFGAFGRGQSAQERDDAGTADPIDQLSAYLNTVPVLGLGASTGLNLGASYANKDRPFSDELTRTEGAMNVPMGALPIFGDTVAGGVRAFTHPIAIGGSGFAVPNPLELIRGLGGGITRGVDRTGRAVLQMARPDIAKEAQEFAPGPEAAIAQRGIPSSIEAGILTQEGKLQSGGEKLASDLGLDPSVGRMYDMAAEFLGPMAVHAYSARMAKAAALKAETAKITADLMGKKAAPDVTLEDATAHIDAEAAANAAKEAARQAKASANIEEDIADRKAREKAGVPVSNVPAYNPYAEIAKNAESLRENQRIMRELQKRAQEEFGRPPAGSEPKPYNPYAEIAKAADQYEKHAFAEDTTPDNRKPVVPYRSTDDFYRGDPLLSESEGEPADAGAEVKRLFDEREKQRAEAADLEARRAKADADIEAVKNAPKNPYQPPPTRPLEPHLMEYLRPDAPKYIKEVATALDDQGAAALVQETTYRNTGHVLQMDIAPKLSPGAEAFLADSIDRSPLLNSERKAAAKAAVSQMLANDTVPLTHQQRRLIATAIPELDNIAARTATAPVNPADYGASPTGRKPWAQMTPEEKMVAKRMYQQGIFTNAPEEAPKPAVHLEDGTIDTSGNGADGAQHPCK